MESLEIDIWLKRQGIKKNELADALRVSAELVGKAIKGERRGPKARKVIRELKKRGCPAEWLRKGKKGAQEPQRDAAERG